MRSLKAGLFAIVATLAIPMSLSAADAPKVERAVTSERAAFIKKHRTETIGGRLSKELDAETEKEWLSSFWGAALIRENTPEVREALGRGLASWDDRGDEFRRALLQVVYTLFPGDFVEELDGLLPRIEDSRQFAIATEYLVRAGEDRAAILSTLNESFPDESDDPTLTALRQRLETPPAEMIKERPSLLPLLSREFLPGEAVVYTFTRLDRRQPAATVIRGADGKFLRDGDRIFSIPHLAMSVSDMPGYLSNGNGAQGVYSIRGIGVSNNVFIGVSPFLWTQLPVETSPEEYFHGRVDTTDWTRDLYTELLPEPWREYLPMRESWYAGAAGRSELILHGTTIDPEFYKGEPYYPNTPSLGAATATELWSPEDGSLVRSDQITFIDAWRSLKTETGFFVLVELDAKKKPVQLSTILNDLTAAEKLVP